MSRVSKSQYALLGLLSLEPATGYQIKKKFNSSLAHFWDESFGQIYPMLKRLVAQGWAVQVDQSPSGGRAEKLYAITPKGEEALDAWLNTLSDRPAIRIELLLKLYFGTRRTPDINLKDMQRFKGQMEEVLARYEQSCRPLYEDPNLSPQQAFKLITLDRGILFTRAMVEWSDRTLERLRTMRGK